MMRWGGCLSAARVRSMSSVVQQMAIHLLSIRSRSVCACGRMRRPLGACGSCGMTSSTVSPAWARLPVSDWLPLSGIRPASVFRSSSSPVPFMALTGMMSQPSRLAMSASRVEGTSFIRSTLFNTATKGTLACLSSPAHAASSSSVAPSVTTMAMSACLMTSRVRSVRRSPTLPVSSKPAVSMSTHGPSGRISIDLLTGSVVVPATSLTMAICWPVRALISDDLPTLRRPNSAMCTLSLCGALLKLFTTNILMKTRNTTNTIR